MNRKLIALGLTAGFLAGGAQAATNTDTLGVQIVIQNLCTVTVTDDVDFGTQNEVNTTAWEDTGTVTFACSANAPVTVDLDAGLNPVGGATDFANRQMLDAVSGDLIVYTLRTAAGGGGSILGDGTGGTALAYNANSTGNNATQTLTVHGITATGQGAKSAGTYNDTVTATITY